MKAYILGAGASFHAGYPLASTMGADLFSWMLRFPPDHDFNSAAANLSERFGQSPSIEAVVTQLQRRIAALGSGNEEDRLERALLAHWRGTLRAAVREWFREVRQNVAVSYARFAEDIVQPGDVVITFNYDDSLERELARARKWDIARGYGFSVGHGTQESPTLLLKLHGSTNWLASIFAGMTTGVAQVGGDLSLGFGPFVSQSDLEYLGYAGAPGHEFPGGGAVPALIMPAQSKEFFFETSFGQEWVCFWESLWSRAAERLRQAAEVILCGYSLLPVDERARELILTSPPKEATVTIVCGDQSHRIAQDFLREGFSNVTCEANPYFEEWIIARSSLMAR